MINKLANDIAAAVMYKLAALAGDYGYMEKNAARTYDDPIARLIAGINQKAKQLSNKSFRYGGSGGFDLYKSPAYSISDPLELKAIMKKRLQGRVTKPDFGYWRNFSKRNAYDTPYIIGKPTDFSRDYNANIRKTEQTALSKFLNDKNNLEAMQDAYGRELYLKHSPLLSLNDPVSDMYKKIKGGAKPQFVSDPKPPRRESFSIFI